MSCKVCLLSLVSICLWKCKADSDGLFHSRSGMRCRNCEPPRHESCTPVHICCAHLLTDVIVNHCEIHTVPCPPSRRHESIGHAPNMPGLWTDAQACAWASTYSFQAFIEAVLRDGQTASRPAGCDTLCPLCPDRRRSWGACCAYASKAECKPTATTQDTFNNRRGPGPSGLGAQRQGRGDGHCGRRASAQRPPPAAGAGAGGS